MTTEDEQYSFVICPHCESGIIIHKKEYNCKIFRHGAYKNTGKQINPHLKQIKCDQLVSSNIINGCGKPFKLVLDENDVVTAEICDYI
jgi:uncharacterized C2H2 Zn-finger protein